MRHNFHRWRGGLVAAAGVSILSGAVAPAQAPGESSAVNIPTCDRACLIGHVRGYMTALAGRKPESLELAADVVAFDDFRNLLAALNHVFERLFLV